MQFRIMQMHTCISKMAHFKDDDDVDGCCCRESEKGEEWKKGEERER